MATIVFNHALGIERTLVNNVKSGSPANSRLVLVGLAAAGLEADSTLRRHKNLSTLLAGSSNEPTNAGYVRKTIVAADIPVVAEDDVLDRFTTTWPNQEWTAVAAAGGAWGALVVCYDPDVTGGNDTEIIPIAKLDFTVTPDGNNIIFRPDASLGWLRLRSVN